MQYLCHIRFLNELLNKNLVEENLAKVSHINPNNRVWDFCNFKWHKFGLDLYPMLMPCKIKWIFNFCIWTPFQSCVI